MKGTGGRLLPHLAGVIVVIVAMTASGSAQPDPRESFIRCLVEGGNIPVKTTIMEFYKQGEGTYLSVRQDSWDTQAGGETKTVKISPEDYDRLWRWVEAEGVWDLTNAIFSATDAPVYLFYLKQGERQRTIRALSVSTLENQTYYRFYLLLRETRDRYVKN